MNIQVLEEAWNCLTIDSSVLKKDSAPWSGLQCPSSLKNFINRRVISVSFYGNITGQEAQETVGTREYERKASEICSQRCRGNKRP